VIEAGGDEPDDYKRQKMEGSGRCEGLVGSHTLTKEKLNEEEWSSAGLRRLTSGHGFTGRRLGKQCLE